MLDPFCGAGTTIKVARNMQRAWVGYETIEKYRALALRRVHERLALRKQLIATFDKIEYGDTIAHTRPAVGRTRAPFRRVAPTHTVPDPSTLPLFAKHPDA